MTMTVAWLVADGRVLASATIADTRRQRRRGLIGVDDVEGAFVIPRCKWVHSVGMRFPLDIAYLDDESRVVKVQRLAPMRLPLPVPTAHTVVEARAGSFERWRLHVGDTVEVRCP